ncbi:MAG: fumarate hydratase [Candidatus Latescibacteria bacterium]|nr:fumarate hydratase [Candidatus Latescibacterota bacterium]
MRTLAVSTITQAVKTLCVDANVHLGDDMVKALQKAIPKESSESARSILSQLVENARIAASDEVPLCQDTGFAVFFVRIGGDVRVDGDIGEAIQEGVRQGYQQGYLRKSIVGDPLRRTNTGDNTPAVIHYDLVPGDQIEIRFAPKGGGSENMSEIRMLRPADGIEGVRAFVVDRVRRSGGNPCPPLIVGVGIGGTFEKCAQLAKRTLFRSVGVRNPDPFYADLEERLLEEINALGIGPQGLGGRTTALDVHIEMFPCHIASLPVAVNLQCHAARHGRVVL